MMTRRLPLLAAAMALGVRAPAHSQTGVLTPDQVVRTILVRHPLARAAVSELRAAGAGTRAAGAFPNPELALLPGITSLSGTGEELLLRQPLGLNGERAARSAELTSRGREVRSRLLAELREMLSEARLAYWEVARTRSALAQAAEAVALAVEFERLVRAAVATGSRPGIDATQAALETAQAKRKLAAAEAEARDAELALGGLLGSGEAAVATLDLPAQPAPIPTLAEAQRLAESRRSEATTETARAEAFRAQARGIRASYRPDLAPQVRLGSVFRGVRDGGIGLELTLPLFDYGSRRHQRRQAEALAAAAQERAVGVRSAIVAEVTRALAREAAEGERLAAFTSEILGHARRLLDASRAGYESGLYPMFAYLEGRRSYQELLSEHLEVRAAYARSVVERERATGWPDEEVLSVVFQGTDSDRKGGKL